MNTSKLMFGHLVSYLHIYKSLGNSCPSDKVEALKNAKVRADIERLFVISSDVVDLILSDLDYC